MQTMSQGVFAKVSWSTSEGNACYILCVQEKIEKKILSDFHFPRFKCTEQILLTTHPLVPECKIKQECLPVGGILTTAFGPCSSSSQHAHTVGK